MATRGSEDELRFSPTIEHLLQKLRARVRGYVWLEGIASAVAWLGVAFWLTLVIDWFFEPSRAGRGLMLAAVCGVLLAILFRLIVRRAFVRMTDLNMAMLLERRFHELDESLLTTVETSGHHAKADVYSEKMLADTYREAEQKAGSVQVAKVFNPGPLRRSLSAAVLLVVSVGLFAAMFTPAFGTWADRVLMFSNRLWPRRTHLTVEGFEGNHVKVARGADLDVVARADMRSKLVPDVVHVHYETEDGADLRATMNRVGNADREKDEYQEYSYTFQGILSSIRFDLHGGDAWVEDLYIDVVENPTLLPVSLDLKYPEYMDRKPRTVSVTGVMQIPLGTEVTVLAEANKDLVRVQVDSALEENSDPTELAPSAEDPRSFQFPIPSLDEDTALLFTLFDTDGIKSRVPVRLALAAVPDGPPELEVRLRGIGSAITPQARIPAEGRVLEDYGVARVWFEYVVDKGKPQEAPIATLADNQTELPLDAAVEAHDLGVQPGNKVTLGVKAADRYNLGAAPNVGASDRWVLEVVTPEQLRTMLESRELVLRQRFEVILHEVEETRELLARIEFELPPPEAKPDNEGTEPEKPAADPAAEPGDEPAAEPGDDPEAGAARSLEQIRNRAIMAAQKCSLAASKNRHEVLGVAVSFDEIREELINNRIDSENLRSRLKDGIADPLRVVGDEMFPRLEQRLAELEATIADPERGGRNRLLAVQQVDLILVRMNAVLKQMMKLETFNEAIAELRSIIDAQKKLKEATDKRHKDKLRDLLE